MRSLLLISVDCFYGDFLEEEEEEEEKGGSVFGIQRFSYRTAKASKNVIYRVVCSK